MDELGRIAETLERCFDGIAATRMVGVPILNPALAVKAVGFRPWQDNAVGILLTPWFMNIVLLPAASEALLRVGSKRIFALPAGQFEFIYGHEDDIGPFWMCSLFSPVLDFADQETALAVAEASVAELFAEAIEDSEDEVSMARMWRGETPIAGEDGLVWQAAGSGDAIAGGVAEDVADVAIDDAQDDPASAPAPAAVSRRAFLRGRATRAETGS